MHKRRRSSSESFQQLSLTDSGEQIEATQPIEQDEESIKQESLIAASSKGKAEQLCTLLRQAECSPKTAHLADYFCTDKSAQLEFKDVRTMCMHFIAPAIVNGHTTYIEKFLARYTPDQKDFDTYLKSAAVGKKPTISIPILLQAGANPNTLPNILFNSLSEQTEIVKNHQKYVTELPDTVHTTLAKSISVPPVREIIVTYLVLPQRK